MMRSTSVLLVFLGCVSSYGVFGLEEISVDNGLHEGSWGNVEQCSEGTTFAMDFKYEQEGHLDNTGGNSLKLFCHNGDGQIGDYITSTEGQYGEWQGIRNCPKGTNIVGYRLRVLPYQGTFGDDEGVNDVQVECSDGTVLDGLLGLVEQGDKTNDSQQLDEENDDVVREWMDINGRRVEIIHPRKVSRGVKDFGDWGNWARCSTGSVVGIVTRVEQGHPVEDDAGLNDVSMYCQ